jgi:hypothetical protein
MTGKELILPVCNTSARFTFLLNIYLRNLTSEAIPRDYFSSVLSVASQLQHDSSSHRVQKYCLKLQVMSCTIASTYCIFQILIKTVSSDCDVFNTILCKLDVYWNWNLLLFVLMGWDYVSELRPPTGLLFIPQMTGEYRELRWNDIDGGKPKKIEEKPVPVPISPPQIPLELGREPGTPL